MTFPVTFIPYINIVLIMVFVLFAWRAFHKGFLILFLETVSLFVALILAGLLAKPLALALPLEFVDNVLITIPLIGPLFATQISTIIWFIILFIAISVILWLIRPLFHIIGKIPVIKGLNSLLGLGFGLIQAFILIWIFSLILLTPLFTNGQDVIQNSGMKYYSSLTNVVLVNTDIKEMSIIKALTNASLDEEDRDNISVWLDNSSVESPEKEVVFKILVKDNLTSQDIEILRLWLNEYKIDQAKIDELLERFK